MFSFTSHTAGKREERRKTDRKAGKERRKGQKTLASMVAEVKSLDYTSAPTIWCIGRNGHWGTPVVDDKGHLVIQNYCADCKHFDDEHIKWLKSPEGLAWSEEQAAQDRALFYYGSSEWEADVIEAMEEQRVRNEQKWLRIAALERETAVIRANMVSLELLKRLEQAMSLLAANGQNDKSMAVIASTIRSELDTRKYAQEQNKGNK